MGGFNRTYSPAGSVSSDCRAPVLNSGIYSLVIAVAVGYKSINVTEGMV